MTQENPLKMLQPSPVSPGENDLKTQQQAQWEKKRRNLELAEKQAQLLSPVKGLKNLPNMPGITADTKKNLKFKSLSYMLRHDKGLKILRHFLKKPLTYSYQYLSSLFQKKAYYREEDFFFYGLKNTQDFLKHLQKKSCLLVVGFSYCHKPLECPSGRFNDQCLHSSENPVCQQCFIYKVQHLLPNKKVVPVIIPTIHYIGNTIFELTHKHPDKEILFLITACEMTLEMFGDWGNMVKAKGIGVRLDGRICNTMKAFELSEKGIKPGLTLVLPETQEKILQLVKAAYIKNL